MFYNPNVTWHNSWLSATAGDKPFADVYKVDGLRGIYIASQIIESAVLTTNGTPNLRSISPNDLRSLITFDGGEICLLGFFFRNQLFVYLFFSSHKVPFGLPSKAPKLMRKVAISRVVKTFEDTNANSTCLSN